MRKHKVSGSRTAVGGSFSATRSHLKKALRAAEQEHFQVIWAIVIVFRRLPCQVLIQQIGHQSIVHFMTMDLE
jgi:hypothetical protein